MRFLSIDRVEGHYAVCQDDDEKIYKIKTSGLPESSKPGDILMLSSDGDWVIDGEETARRKKYILNLQEKLFKRD